MIKNALHTVGIVSTVVLLMVLVIVTLYVSYILALGVLLIGATFVVYQLVTIASTEDTTQV